MIPASVPEVMNKLQILSLEIERMPKSPQREFSDMFNLPYHSVCTTSTHDMTPLRNWWKEDPEKTQRYYNHVLQRIGEAPDECTAEIVAQIISNHYGDDRRNASITDRTHNGRNHSIPDRYRIDSPRSGDGTYRSLLGHEEIIPHSQS